MFQSMGGIGIGMTQVQSRRGFLMRPKKPLAPHALYLSGDYCRSYGSHDTGNIDRRSLNGCSGLYNGHIAELFGLAGAGTQVKLI